MDYRNYDYKGKVYDLKNAYTLISQGEWDRMIWYLKRTLNCSEEEARNIGNDIKAAWLEERNKALQNAEPKKKKRGIGGKIIIFLFIIALAGGAYYWFVLQPQQYAIENVDSDVETEYVGTVELPTDIQNGFRTRYVYEEAERVLEMMDNSDGQFFYLEECDSEELYELYKTDNDTFAEKLHEADIQGAGSLDKLNVRLANRMKGIVGLDYEELDTLGNGNTYFDDFSATVNGKKEYRFTEDCFKGQNPSDYFKEHELELTCNSIKLKKVAIDAFERELGENGGEVIGTGELNVYCIYEASVTTDHCNGESSFPDQGETETLTIKLMTDLGLLQDPIYHYFTFH